MMAATARIDASRLRRKFGRARSARPAARREAVVELVGPYVTTIAFKAARDTNRFVNGFIAAGEDVGARVPPQFALNRSGRYFQIRRRLVRQAEFWARQEETWEEYVRRYVAREAAADPKRRRYRSRTPSHRKARRTLNKITQIAERAQDELDAFDEAAGEGNEAVIAIGGRKGKKKYRLGSLTTVRVKTFGGAGRIFEAGGQVFVELRNMEPHARIVERRTRILKRALFASSVRRVGFRRASRRYIERIAQASDLRRAA